MLEMVLKKVYFLVYPSLKVQLFIFVFFVRAEHYCTRSVFHCSRGKSADETVKFGQNSCPPILVMKKTAYFYLKVVSNISITFQLKIRLKMALKTFLSLSKQKSDNNYE